MVVVGLESHGSQGMMSDVIASPLCRNSLLPGSYNVVCSREEGRDGMSMLISHCLNVISEVPSLTHRKKLCGQKFPIEWPSRWEIKQGHKRSSF